MSFWQKQHASRLRRYVGTFALEEANEARIALKHDAIRGAGVLDMMKGK